MIYIENKPFSLSPIPTSIISDVGLNLKPEEQGQIKAVNDFTLIRDQLANLGIKAEYRAIQSDNFVSGSAGWKLGADGIISATGIQLTGGIIDGASTIGGRLASTLASAIDGSGHFIDTRLNTSSKQILGDFTFGESGAIKMITDADNGVWISPTGILGKKAGVNTFTIGIDGDAVYSGNVAINQLTAGTMTSKAFILAVAAGTGDSYIAGGNNLDLENWRGGDANGGAFILGLDDSATNDPAKLFIGNYSASKYFSYNGSDLVMKGGAITGGTIQTASSGKRIRLLSTSGSTPTQSANSIGLIDSSNNLIWSAGSEESIIQKILPRSAEDMGLTIESLPSLDYTAGSLVQFVVNTDGASSARTLYVEGNGTGITQEIMGVGGIALLITKHVNGVTTTALQIDQATNACVLDINKTATGIGTVIDITNAGTGKSLYINQTETTNASSCVDITDAGTGSSLQIVRTSGTASLPMLLFSNNGGGRVVEFTQDSASSSVDLMYLTHDGSGRYINCDNGAYLSNGGTWTDACSKTLKTDFQTPNLKNIVEKIKKLNILNYVYKTDKKHKKNIRHLTPMAEDAYKLFGLGDNKGLSANDMAGLALLGVQFLLSKQK